MEITEIVKGYTLKQLIKDLTELDYEHFREAYEYLVRNGECNVWVNGNIRDLTTEEACKIGEIMGQSSHQIRLCGKLIDPYLLDDCHIVEAARKPCNVDVIRFSFDKSVDMLDRYIWVNIETHKVPESNKEINIDAYDASLTAGVAELSSIKGLFENPVDKEQYEAARNSVMMKYFRWLEKEPFVFALKYMEMQMWGLSLPEFLRTMDALDYEGYLSSERAVRPIITEAQIAMRRNLNG